MQQRNPFTSISNYSFVRNAHNFESCRPASRSYSGNSHSSDYKGMYLRDPYLFELQSRKKQEILTSKLLGVQSLRYEPQVVSRIEESCFQSSGEYYNTQTIGSPPPTLPLSSDCQHTAMKASTKDMFSSDYFKKRQNQQQNQDDEYRIEVRKPASVFKKQGNIQSRFKQTTESNPIDEVVQKSETVIQKSQKRVNSQKSQKRIKSKSIVTTSDFGDPQTIFLKSRRTIFYLYQNFEEDDSL